jgi:hypothetical protein
MEQKNKILQISSLVDTGITNFLNCTEGIPMGRFESIVESRIILNLCIRYLESINELAKSDMVYLPSVMVLSRSLFESAINALWLLYPSDIFECESRFISRLEQYEASLNKLIKFYKSHNWKFSDIDAHLQSINNFSQPLKELLLSKGYKISLVPNFRDMLKSVNEERKYLYYSKLSDYTHGGYNSTWIYRKNLGTLKEFGEYIEINDWKLVYAVSWPVFEIATEYFVSKATSCQIKNLYSDDFKRRIRESINLIE